MKLQSQVIVARRETESLNYSQEKAYKIFRHKAGEECEHIFDLRDAQLSV